MVPESLAEGDVVRSSGAMREDNRYVRIRCPLCQMVSPAVDQRNDIRRVAMAEWWRLHLRGHQPAPIIERAAEPVDV